MNAQPCGACDGFIPSGAFSRCETHHRATSFARVIADCPSFKPALREETLEEEAAHAV